MSDYTPFDELKFTDPDNGIPELTLTTAVDAILTRLRTLTDLNGETIYRSAERGLLVGSLTASQEGYLTLTPPHRDMVPCVRLWHDSSVIDLQTIQHFHFQSNTSLSLYIYLYSYGKDGDGNPIDIQKKREELVRYTLAALEHPDEEETAIGEGNLADGLTPDFSLWQFALDSTIRIDHTNAFRSISEDIAVLPPYYVTRVDIPIETFGDYHTTD